ncbi:MAG TPA: hypothetical protein PKB10_07765, partial [Tepidisphaeraceae bacterium]|nr:hypothetical protein [Tepidisphaeraceae bacterium]
PAFQQFHPQQGRSVHRGVLYKIPAFLRENFTTTDKHRQNTAGKGNRPPIPRISQMSGSKAEDADPSAVAPLLLLLLLLMMMLLDSIA